MAKLEEGMEVCESCEVHENLLKIVNEKMPEETELYDLAELFKVFGDSTRMRILFVLFEAEVCVCDLAEALNMTQSAISHQLRILSSDAVHHGNILPLSNQSQPHAYALQAAHSSDRIPKQSSPEHRTLSFQTRGHFPHGNALRLR